MGKKSKRRNLTGLEAEVARSIGKDLSVVTIPPGMDGNEFTRRLIALTGDISLTGNKLDLAAATQAAGVRRAIEVAARVIARDAEVLAAQRKRAANARTKVGSVSRGCITTDELMRTLRRVATDDDGRPRSVTAICNQLRAQGVRVSRKRVGRLLPAVT